MPSVLNKVAVSAAGIEKDHLVKKGVVKIVQVFSLILNVLLTAAAFNDPVAVILMPFSIGLALSYQYSQNLNFLGIDNGLKQDYLVKLAVQNRRPLIIEMFALSLQTKVKLKQSGNLVTEEQFLETLQSSK